MPPPDPTPYALARIADAVARAADLEAAYDVLIAGLSSALQTRAGLFERRDRGWTLIAGTEDAAVVPDLQRTLGRLSPGEVTRLPDPYGSTPGAWTAASLEGPGGPPVVLLLAGDWTAPHALSSTWFLCVSYALCSVQERDVRRRTERLLVSGYTMARRLSRLGGIEVVAGRVADHVARLMNAERVAVALYRAAEDCLGVAATHGYPLSTVDDIRIQPGAWVIGHVYSSGRPLFVRDVRSVRGMPQDRQRYRTYSFAAVPMFAGGETVGVLTATDKRDGSAFNRLDITMMRTLSVAAAVTIVAARSQAEVSRLSYAVTVDSLTALLNRPYLDARLHQEIERARRGATLLTVLMADIDDFKIINDTYGHQTGDAVLQVVAGIIRTAVRVFDMCARYGGDEFVILMPNSDYSSAVACAERIRQRVDAYRGEERGGVRLPALTVSIGFAVIGTGDTPADLIRRADESMYLAKADGKNRVRAHPSVLNGGPTPTPDGNGKEKA